MMVIAIYVTPPVLFKSFTDVSVDMLVKYIESRLSAIIRSHSEEFLLW